MMFSLPCAEFYVEDMIIEKKTFSALYGYPTLSPDRNTLGSFRSSGQCAPPYPLHHRVVVKPTAIKRQPSQPQHHTTATPLANLAVLLFWRAHRCTFYLCGTCHATLEITR
jgi:hypothetical protein